MTNDKQIEQIVESLGFEPVRVMIIGNVNKTLQVMIDRLDGSQINVDDCAKVSRALNAFFEENQTPENDYTLEVSSPGIDRPLTKLAHFTRFINSEAKIETSDIVEERKRFKGKILSTNDKSVVILMDGIEYTIPYTSINKAKLVLTDELLTTLELQSEEE